MNWFAFESGKSIGQSGSEGGIIIRDDEYDSGARITLERDTHNAPFAITCGIYGWMVHTRFIGTESEALSDYERIKSELSLIISKIPLESDPDGHSNLANVFESLSQFVEKYP